MKKVLVTLMIVMMVVSMAACGNQNSKNVSPQDGPSSLPEDTSGSVTDNGNLQGEGDSEFTSENDGSQNENDSERNDDSVSGEQYSNILIVYFSRVGNTDWEEGVDAVTSASINVEDGTFVGNAEYLAKMAQEVTGGELFLIQTEVTYPSDYRKTTDTAAEKQDGLASHVENMDQYDTIVLIYPKIEHGFDCVLCA